MIAESAAPLFSAEALNLDNLEAGPDPVRLAEELWQGCVQYQREADTRYISDIRFALLLDHWEYGQIDPNTGAEMLTTQLLYDLLRHNTSELARTPINTECYPTDGQDTDQRAEVAKRAMDSDIQNPRKKYRSFRRRAILGAMAGGRGLVKLEWDQRTKECVFGNVSPTRFYVAPGWSDMHDLTCPYVIEEVDARFSDVLAMGSEGWDVEGLSYDGASDARTDRSSTAGGRIPDLVSAGNYRVARFDMPLTRRVKLLKIWLRHDDEEESQVDSYLLDPEEQYMACTSCGHQEFNHPRGPGSGFMLTTPLPGSPTPPMRSEFVPEGSLPDVGDECPACGAGELERAAVMEEETAYRKFPDGRFLVVAINQRKKLRDGPWPCRMPSFPFAMFKCSEHPEDPWGVNETQLHRGLQVADEVVLNSAYQQAISNVDILIAVEDSLKDAAGEPFVISNMHKSIAYVDSPSALQSIQHFQGSGIAPGLLELAQSLHQRFEQTKGTTDIGLQPQQTKNIAASSLKQLTAMANVPIADKQEMIQEEEGILFSCLNAMQAHYWDEQRKIRVVGPDGALSWLQVHGDDLPYVDVIVSGPPALNQAAADDLDKFDRWLQYGYAGDVAAQEVAGTIIRLPIGLQRMYFQAQMRNAGAAGAAPPGGPGGNGRNPAGQRGGPTKGRAAFEPSVN